MTKQSKTNDPYDALSGTHRKAALMLVQGKTGREVAAILNVHESTVNSWKNHVTFQAYSNLLRVEIYEAVRDSLRLSCIDAIDTIRDVMKNSDNEAIRLKAASMLLATTGANNPTEMRLEVGHTCPDYLMMEQEQKEQSFILLKSLSEQYV